LAFDGKLRARERPPRDDSTSLSQAEPLPRDSDAE
jgi:hypothetical protein